MRSAPIILTGLMALGLAGCGPAYDPLTRYGVWTPEHVNRANLALSVANPADLVRGTGETGSDGNLDAAAVNRLETNKVKKLPASGLTSISVTGGGGEQ